MSQEIAAIWSQLMSGQELDIERFVAGLLGAVARTGSVVGRVRSPTELEFCAGTDTTVFSATAANAKFRMVCARLATLFGGESQVPPLLYGGVLVANVHTDKVSLHAELEFKNTAQGAWFSVRRRP